MPRLRNPTVDEITGMLFVQEHNTHAGDSKGGITGSPANPSLGRCGALVMPVNTEQPVECWGSGESSVQEVALF